MQGGSEGRGVQAEQNGTETPQSRESLRLDLDRLALQLEELKVLYEQYFLGIITLPPDKPHQQLKSIVRKLRKAPFKGSDLSYRLRALEMRYNTLNTYWQRVLREREAGTYVRDIFKANLRERIAMEDQFSKTAAGKAESGIRSLYDSYRQALQQQGGKSQKVDFDQFQDSLLAQARDFKEKNGAAKLSFAIVVQNGKVSVKAKAV